jgi:hypothetical protein
MELFFNEHFHRLFQRSLRVVLQYISNIAKEVFGSETSQLRWYTFWRTMIVLLTFAPARCIAQNTRELLSGFHSLLEARP